MENINNQNGSVYPFYKEFLVLLFTAIIGFSIGLLGDFVKIALTDLKNYNAVKVKAGKPEIEEKSIKFKYEIYKLGDNPSSFDFDFALTEKAGKSSIEIDAHPEVNQVSESVLDYGDFVEKYGETKNGMFTITFNQMHKYDRYEVIITLSTPSKIERTDGLFKLNVKTTDAKIKALEKGFFDFLFSLPVYATAIVIAIFSLMVITLVTYFIIGVLLKKKIGGTKIEKTDESLKEEKGETNDAEK